MLTGLECILLILIGIFYEILLSFINYIHIIAKDIKNVFVMPIFFLISFSKVFQYIFNNKVRVDISICH